METLTPAEKMYKSHLINVSNYQKRNPEKMSLKYYKRMAKLKEDPEAYQVFRLKLNESNKKSLLKRKQALEAENAKKS